jgi:hypothetical protein
MNMRMTHRKTYQMVLQAQRLSTTCLIVIVIMIASRNNPLHAATVPYLWSCPPRCTCNPLPKADTFCFVEIVKDEMIWQLTWHDICRMISKMMLCPQQEGTNVLTLK